MLTVHILGADGLLIQRLEGAGLALQWGLIHVASAKAPDTAYVSRARDLDEAQLTSDILYHSATGVPPMPAETAGTAIAVPIGHTRKNQVFVYAPTPVIVETWDSEAREALRASIVAALTAVREYGSGRGIRHVLLPVVDASSATQAAAIVGAYTDLVTGARSPDCRQWDDERGVRVTVGPLTSRSSGIPLTAAESQRVMELVRF